MAKEDDEIHGGGEEPAAPVAEENPHTINVGEDADDDDDGDSGAPAQAARPDGKPGRRQQFRQMRDQTRAQAEVIQRLERDMAELRGRASAPTPIVVPQRQAAPDPVESELDNIEAQKQATLVALRATTDEAKAEQLTKQWNKLDRQRIKVETAAQVRDQLAAAEARRPRSDPQRDAEVAQLRGTFPKIFADENLKAAADAEASIIAARTRRPMSLEIAQEAAATIYARYGLGVRRSAPTDADRAKHAATASRPGTAARVTFTPNKGELKNAMAYTEHRRDSRGQPLSDQQRIKAYYDEVLKPAGLSNR